MQIVLNVDDTQAWVDSQGRERSALDQFSLLAPALREAHLAEADTSLIAWELGFLTTGDEAPEFCKPQPLPLDGDPTFEAYALGYMLAKEVNQGLHPFWSEVVLGLLGQDRARIFANDRLPIVDEATDWFEALFRKAFPEHAGTVQKAQNYCTVTASGEQLARLVHSWWPSGLGFMGGVVFTPEASPAVRERVARTACVDSQDLRYVSILFQTIRTYDNAGIGVLSAPGLKHELIQRLREAGWEPGRMIEAP